MAQRPIWRGHLRLALVSCPVALYTANHDRETIRFNMINPATNSRIRMVTVDGQTGEKLERNQLVKGYEFKREHYVILDDADFESVRVDSSSTMTVEKFIPQATLDPIYYDASYYLGPDGDAGADVFAVLHDAIVASGKVALSRVVISRRERVLVIVPMGRGLVAHTLHEERDLNSAADVFDKIPQAKPDPEMVKLATMLIDRQTGTYDPADVVDRYEARLRQLIDAKIKGEGFDSTDHPAPDHSNVIDLMAALKKSLGAGAAAESSAAAPKTGTREEAGASRASTAAVAKPAKPKTASPEKPKEPTVPITAAPVAKASPAARKRA